jgi:predicted acylesterase/phospholipase RssA
MNEDLHVTSNVEDNDDSIEKKEEGEDDEKNNEKDDGIVEKKEENEKNDDSIEKKGADKDDDVVTESDVFVPGTPPPSEYDTLVLSGTMTRGVMVLGALQCAYDNFILSNIDTYIGTSCGALINYLLIIGFTPVEILVYVCTNQVMEKLQHVDTMSMLNGHGALSFSSIQEHLERMTINKIGYLPTLENLKKRFNKTLICTTYNFTTKKEEYLSPETHPELPCIIALRMSAGLPFLFETFKYENNSYIDGGIANNFPIDKGDEIGKKILGIDLDGSHFESENNNIIEFLYNILKVPIYHSTKCKIEAASDKCNVIRLKCEMFGILKALNTHKKIELFSDGYNQFKTYI